MGQYMKEEPSDEFIGLQCHGLLFITIGIIPPAERDIAVLDLEDTVITDSDPVGISAQILKDTLGAVERRLAIDNPFFMIELPSEHLKGSSVLQMTDAAREDKITRFKTAFEIVQELVLEQLRQNLYMDEEILPTRYPAASVGGQSSSRYDTVNMGMIHEVLSPGVKDADKPYACAEMLRIIGECHKRLGDRAEQYIVHDPLIHDDQRI